MALGTASPRRGVFRVSLVRDACGTNMRLRGQRQDGSRQNGASRPQDRHILPTWGL